jgi:hypothetical protein
LLARIALRASLTSGTVRTGRASGADLALRAVSTGLTIRTSRTSGATQRNPLNAIKAKDISHVQVPFKLSHQEFGRSSVGREFGRSSSRLR